MAFKFLLLTCLTLNVINSNTTLSTIRMKCIHLQVHIYQPTGGEFLNMHNCSRELHLWLVHVFHEFDFVVRLTPGLGGLSWLLVLPTSLSHCWSLLVSPENHSQHNLALYQMNDKTVTSRQGMSTGMSHCSHLHLVMDIFIQTPLICVYSHGVPPPPGVAN